MESREDDMAMDMFAQWLCEECSNDYDVYFLGTKWYPSSTLGTKWYPSSTKVKTCDDCGRETDCIPYLSESFLDYLLT
jgi:hypothetical protein